MIQRLLGIIEEECGARLDGVATYNVLITGAVIYAIYAPGGAHYYAKITDSFDMEHEYEGTKIAYRAFPDNVAEPVGFRDFDGKQVIMCKGVEHVPLRKRDVLRPNRRLRHDLIEFFSTCQRELRSDESHALDIAFLRELADGRVSDDALRTLESRCEEGNAYFSGRQGIRQHGDFTVNNIGLTGQGLFVFDWEDFGKVTAAGFDVCMLLVSAFDFDARKLGRFLAGDGHKGLRDIMTESARANAIPDHQFIRLIPYYLILNARLKYSYGRSIVDKNLALAAALSHAGS